MIGSPKTVWPTNEIHQKHWTTKDKTNQTEIYEGGILSNVYTVLESVSYIQFYLCPLLCISYYVCYQLLCFVYLILFHILCISFCTTFCVSYSVLHSVYLIMSFVLCILLAIQAKHIIKPPGSTGTILLKAIIKLLVK